MTGARDARLLLVSSSGISVLLSTHGAGIVALHMPDREGRFDDVVLGFDSAAEYADQASMYFGCTVGRVANRIKGASFDLDGETYPLVANDGRNHLHGGSTSSFDRVEWEVRPRSPAAPHRVMFDHRSGHLDEGYPGHLEATVTYELEDDDLTVRYEARTDRPTPVSLTNHSYWNLAGAGAGSILDHELVIAADQFTPTDDELIPLGTIEGVGGTPLDFREPCRIGDRIDELEGTGAAGYDHNYVLSGPADGIRFAARLREPISGRMVEVWTDRPCLQFYSGNLMRPTSGKASAHYARRSALCLEPQAYPDAVHQPSFPSIVLQPDEVYHAVIVFRLRVDGSSRAPTGPDATT